MSTRRPFRLVTQHLGDPQNLGRTRIVAFATGEAAAAAAARLTPDADGSVFPNLPDSVIEAVEARGFEYWQGHFWWDNRYAVVFQHRSATPD